MINESWFERNIKIKLQGAYYWEKHLMLLNSN